MEHDKEWEKVQRDIWACERCHSRHRVECNIRQQTDSPPSEQVRLLIVAVAPPYRPGLTTKTKANSATSDSQDRLRLFIEESLRMSWSDLVARRLFLLHAVKCAIIPSIEGFQNPDNQVVDLCASEHLAKEIRLASPGTILVMGGAARRAVVKILGTNKPRGLRIAGPLSGKFLTEIEGRSVQLIVTRFIRGGGRMVASKALYQAAELTGVIPKR